VGENRHELLWAFLTFVQNWLTLGRPQWSGKPLGSFESWSFVIGGVLEAAGIDGFLGNREELYKRVDTETEEWRAFTLAWWEEHGDAPVGTADLVPLVERGLLPSLLKTLRQDAGPRALSTRLGRALAEHRDRRYGQYFLRDLGPDGHTKLATYRLEPAIDAVPPRSPDPDTAEVPQDEGLFSDSDAVAAVPAVVDHSLAKEMNKGDPEPAGSISLGTVEEVPQVPQVPQSDSGTVDESAVPRSGPRAEVPQEVPRATAGPAWTEEVLE
jgi:hypothetical protein